MQNSVKLVSNAKISMLDDRRGDIYMQSGESKFTGKAEVYARYRLSYPKILIDFLYKESGFTRSSRIADIGAGTGKLSILFAMRGSRVTCVEPNAEMIEAAKKTLKNYTNCKFLPGTAEAIPLPDRSVDFVTAGQAFHWFDHDKFKTECRRILKTGGLVFLVRNDSSFDAEVNAELSRINEKYCPDFMSLPAGIINDSVYNDFFYDGYDDLSYEFDVSSDEDSFVGSALSTSFAPGKGDENYERYVNEIREIFHKYAENGRLISHITTLGQLGAV